MPEIGATMLPTLISGGAPPGEVSVFEKLRKDPCAAGWVVIHDLDEAEHVSQVSGQADFVVIIPNEGIVVIEVKSCLSLRVTERGWYYGNEPKPDTRGPFKQAARAMHSIREHLAALNLARDVPMISAVFFTAYDFNISNTIEWHPWQVLGKTQLHSKPISESILQIIRNARRHFASRSLKWAQGDVCPPATIPAITAALRPFFTILASPRERRQGLEKNLKRCTEQQYEMLDLVSSNDRVLVSGLAGTGKTALALEVIRRSKLSRPKDRVALFCFNKLLGSFFDDERRALQADGVRMGSFHQFMMDLADIPHGSETTDSPAFWTTILPQKVMQMLSQDESTRGQLDLLVIDEAQDLISEPYLQIFDWLLRGGLHDGRWFVFGDFERQAIFHPATKPDELDLLYVGMSRSLHRLTLLCHEGTKDSIRNLISSAQLGEHSMERPQSDQVNRLVSLWADGRCAQVKLDINCRNTPEISEQMTVLARLVAPSTYSRVLRADTNNDPELLFYSSGEDQAKLVSTVLSQILAEGIFKPRDIVLLSAYRDGSLGSVLAASPQWANRLRPFRMKLDCIRYTTIHSFKGLESPVIILTDVDKL
jgi:hypothetical protein